MTAVPSHSGPVEKTEEDNSTEKRRQLLSSFVSRWDEERMGGSDGLSIGWSGRFLFPPFDQNFLPLAHQFLVPWDTCRCTCARRIDTLPIARLIQYGPGCPTDDRRRESLGLRTFA